MANKIENRDENILEAAIECALADGYQWITRDGVAARAGVSPGTVNTAYTTMRDLKRAVLRTAVDRKILRIVAQGLADSHEIAVSAPPELKRAALASLAV